MRKINNIRLLFCVMCLSYDMANAQNDTFFYDDFEREARDVEMSLSPLGLEFGVFSTNEYDLNFGDVNTGEYGLNFGDVNTGENGFNFGDYNTSDDGLKFSGFEMEAENATIGSGVLLLSGLAVLRLRKQNKKRK